MTPISPIFPEYTTTVTVTNGTQVSAAVDLGKYTLAGIFVPSTFDGTTITFTASNALAGTYLTVLSAGTTYTLTCAASTYVPIENLAITAGLRYIKINTGSAQAGTDTVFILSVRPVE